MTSYHIELTDAARCHIKRLIEKQSAVGFRISIKKTGCSGYSYVPSVVNVQEDNDVTIDMAADFPIYIDTTYPDLLQDIIIDLIEEKTMGLKQKKLVFKNPKESGRCGCGESFHVKEVK